MADKWYSGRRMDERREMRRAVMHPDETDEDVQLDLVNVGIAAYAVLRKHASGAEAQLVMAQLITDCQLDVRDGTAALLAEPDLSTPKAREIHLQTRVAKEILNRLNTYVVMGAQAEHDYNTREDPT